VIVPTTSTVAPVPHEPTVEHRGIEYIPASERGATPRSLGFMWLGGLMNVEYVAYGAVVLAFGLSLWQALAVIVVANLSYLLAGLASLPGPVAGTSTFVIARAPFGPNGARTVSVFNWVSMVVYETEGLALVVLAVLTLLHQWGVHGAVATHAGLRHDAWLVVVVVAGATAAQGVLPTLGHAQILRVLKVLTVPFTILFAVLAAVTLDKVHVHVNGSGAGWVGLSVAFAFALSASGLGWTIQASDFSRYLEAGTSPGRIVRAVAVGAGVPSVVLMGLGAVVATAVPGSNLDPISGLPQVVPSWFLVPYLLVIAVQLLAINSLDLYSSGLTLQAIGVPITRMRAVLVDLVLSAALTLVALFASSFNALVSDLITLLIIWVAPWTGVFLVDWALRRGRYDPDALLGAHRRPIPGTPRGFGLPGLVSMGLGMGAAALCISTQVFTGPVSRALGGADLSVPAGLVVAGGAYLLWRRLVRIDPGVPRRGGAVATVATSK
jgi:nucleobase:cation symporter-1, NCS1 family